MSTGQGSYARTLSRAQTSAGRARHWRPGHVAGESLTVQTDGRLFAIPVRCYATWGPCVYVHVEPPWSLRGLGEGTRVLLRVDDTVAPRLGLPGGAWGTLERAKDEDLAPHASRAGGARGAPIFRVRLDSLGDSGTMPGGAR
jgi:hypothetical protein